MRSKRTAWLVWGICALISVTTLALDGMSLSQSAATSSGLQLVGDVAWLLVLAGAPFLAALMLTRQPGNLIGWLLLAPTAGVAGGLLANLYLSRPPSVLTPPLLVLMWFTTWSWLLLVLPPVLVPLFFPTGRPPGARWWWVAAGIAVEALIFIFLATFGAQLHSSADNATWSVPNPIGILPESLVEKILGLWVVILSLLILLCVASLAVRYRRAGVVERAQIRWLLYACALFAAVYVPGFFLQLYSATGAQTQVGKVWSLAFALSFPAIPAAVGIAVLRYRLWDIDVIIRRTLVYSALTLMLGWVYFGGVVVGRALIAPLTGGSNAAIVLSTLGIAALFSPLRRRLQGFIDRRFYRRKYDAAQALAAFGAAARDETDLDRLTAELLRVVQITLQPEHATLWLRETPARGPARAMGPGQPAPTGPL